MSYDKTNCPGCPYYKQVHLSAQYRTSRASPPVRLEDNSSDTLIVLQAPGVEEWANGLPLLDTKKKGGTAGSRLMNSWKKSGKERTNFDIVNVVQCFPGKDANRDSAPHPMAICSCSKRLQSVISAKSYRKIITFGKSASVVVQHIKASTGGGYILIPATHPNGGASRSSLDGLWGR